MTTKTLERLSVGKPWSGQYGDFEVWKLHFADGTTGELNVKKGNLDKAKAKLDPLVGQAAEYELQPGNLDGIFKVKDYPGKNPQQDGGKGGGGKGWQPKSKEERAEILAMNAMSALGVIVGNSGMSPNDGLAFVEYAMDRLMAKAHQVMGVGTGPELKRDGQAGEPRSTLAGVESAGAHPVPTSVESGTDPEFGEGSRDAPDSTDVGTARAAGAAPRIATSVQGSFPRVPAAAVPTERTGHDLRPVPPVEEGDGSGVLPSNGAPSPPGDGPMLIEIERERLGWTKGKLLTFARDTIGKHITTLDWSVLSEAEASKLVKALEES